MDLSIYRSIDLSIYRSIDLSIDLSIYPSIHLSIYPSIHLSIYPSNLIQSNLILSIYLSICKLESEAILRDFLSFWTWQHQKRSNSARLPEFLHLTTSKTKQFCETSSIFELDNIKNEAILRDFLQKWKVECRAVGLVPMRFAIFPLHLSKLLQLPPKSDATSYEVLHLSREIILANLQIWCSKMQPLSGNQRPDLLTALMNMSLVLCLPRKMRLCRSSSNVPPQNQPHATFINAAITMRFASTLCRAQRRNRLTSKRPKPHPPHTGGTLHRRLQPLYTEKHTVSRSGFLPKTSPMQHSCSHYNAFCSTTYTSRQQIQCDLHSLVAEHTGGTDWPRNDPSRTRRTQEVPFIAGCSHFTRKKRIVSCSGFLPKNKPHATLTQPLQCVLQHHVHIHAAITMRFVSTRCRTQKRRNRLASKRSKPHPPHTGGTLHRRLQPLYTDKHTVSRSGFLPKTSPMQHSCSHYNAICIES